MFAPSKDQLRITDSLLTVTDNRRNPILSDCSAGLQLSNGVQFNLQAMETIHHATELDAVVTGGGDSVLPRLEWRTELIDDNTACLTLTVTNTTAEPLSIERLDVINCPSGYRQISIEELYFRRTGWQSFSPASVRQPFSSDDPWLQPPLYAPMMLPTSNEHRSIAWMTVLQSDGLDPLLAGFADAKNYLGTIELSTNTHGHRLVASNYVEGVELASGATITSEPLILKWGEEQEDLLSGYADIVAKNMSARVSRVPTGWCSWNYYFHKVTEQDIINTVSVIKEKQLPFEFVQLDDGYQAKLGDWLKINQQQFPSGMKYVASSISSAGYTPGIWAAPFMAEESSEVFRKHPDWFIHDANGRPFNVNRHGDQYWPSANYGLDLTHPDAYNWIKNTLTTICKDWGFQYLKLDFLYAACQRGVRFDPTYTSVQAFRLGLELIREVAGERYLVGCGTPLLPSVGIFDAMRISADIMPSLPKNDTRVNDVTKPLSRDNIASLWSHAWMNGKLWVNDPDTVRMRQHEIDSGWEEVKALATLVALASGSILDSDNLSTLEPDGYHLLDRLFPLADIKAKAVGKQQKRPAKLSASVVKGDGQWYIAAKYNWTNDTKPFRFIAPDWELPVGRYHVYDLLRQRYIGTRFYKRSADIPPYGAGLLSLCPTRDVPQVVATEHHLLGPAGDIASVSWNDNTLTIDIAEGHKKPVSVLVHVPGILYKIIGHEGCEIQAKVGPIVTVMVTGVHGALTFKPRLRLDLGFGDDSQEGHQN